MDINAIQQILAVASRVDRTKCGEPTQVTCRYGGPVDYHAMQLGHTPDNARKVGIWIGAMGSLDIGAAIGCVDLTRSTIKLIRAPDRLPGIGAAVKITWLIIECDTATLGRVTLAVSDPLQ